MFFRGALVSLLPGRALLSSAACCRLVSPVFRTPPRSCLHRLRLLANSSHPSDVSEAEERASQSVFCFVLLFLPEASSPYRWSLGTLPSAIRWTCPGLRIRRCLLPFLLLLLLLLLEEENEEDEENEKNHWNLWLYIRKPGILSFFFLEKIRFQQNWLISRRKNIMQKTKLHHLQQMWFYLHLANLILAWNSTKSAPLNGHYPKLQFSTFTGFSHAPSHFPAYDLPLQRPGMSRPPFGKKSTWPADLFVPSPVIIVEKRLFQHDVCPRSHCVQLVFDSNGDVLSTDTIYQIIYFKLVLDLCLPCFFFNRRLKLSVGYSYFQVR